MTTQELADELVKSVRQGKGFDFIDKYYADDAIGFEIVGPVSHGKEAILKRMEFFTSEDNRTIHEYEVSDPLVAGNHFAVRFAWQVTTKTMVKETYLQDELAVYEVKDGKIIREQFFFVPPVSMRAKVKELGVEKHGYIQD